MVTQLLENTPASEPGIGDKRIDHTKFIVKVRNTSAMSQMPAKIQFYKITFIVYLHCGWLKLQVRGVRVRVRVNHDLCVQIDALARILCVQNHCLCVRGRKDVPWIHPWTLF